LPTGRLLVFGRRLLRSFGLGCLLGLPRSFFRDFLRNFVSSFLSSFFLGLFFDLFLFFELFGELFLLRLVGLLGLVGTVDEFGYRPAGIGDALG